MKSTLIPTDHQTGREYYWTPGILLELPKYWNCHRKNFARQELSIFDRFYDMAEGDRRTELLRTALEDAANDHAHHHSHRWPWHESWKGSIQIAFPLSWKWSRFKIWYMGKPAYGKGIFDLRKRPNCDECGAVAHYYRWEDNGKQGSGRVMWMKHTCEAHR